VRWSLSYVDCQNHSYDIIVFENMPKYALVGGLEVSEKKRDYDDVCSCDTACDLNFCRTIEEK